MDYLDRLLALQDKDYAAFHARIVPNIDAGTIIGVRVPGLRKMAREIFKEGGYQEFLGQLPHKYYEENMLHAMIINQIKDYDACLAEYERFLPYVDNWAVCDAGAPKAFRANRDRLIGKIREWSAADDTYTCRFGVKTLMDLYLDEAFLPEYLEIPTQIHSEEYYVNMVIAWYYATALAKQWEATLPILLENRLDTWVHNKAIQKARESFRISAEDKEYLKTLKR